MPMLENNSRRHQPDSEVAKRLREAMAAFQTTSQIAVTLGIARSTAVRYCTAGEFPNAIQIEGIHFVPIEDVIAYKRDRRNKMGRPRLSEDINTAVIPKRGKAS